MNSKVAALNRFVSKATDKCLPFFRVSRKSFEWTDECQKAFEDLKKYLSSPPLLSPSMPGEELYLYIAVSQAVVSKRRWRLSTARLFYKQGIPRSRRKVPQDGEVGLCTHDDGAKAQAVFPGPHHHSFDRLAFEKSHEQPRGYWKDSLMGN